MNAVECKIDAQSVQKLLAAASGDAALVYLYIQAGNNPAEAEQALRMQPSRYQCAVATLRQLGLWPEDKTQFIPSGERPVYSEQDVQSAMAHDRDFPSLRNEIEHVLGRGLNTEELKIILSFVRYLGLPADVICVLICYCKERARQRGSMRNPTLRAIEKEAYAWAENGIDTMEAAGAFMQLQNMRQSFQKELMALLQIRGRELTPGEIRYSESWMDMHFEQDVLAMAYERTCLNTGGMNWAYMNKILTRWHEMGLHTLQQVRAGDVKKVSKKAAPRQLDADEMAAIASLMQEV